MAGTTLGTMQWRTEIDNSGLNRGLEESQRQVEGFGKQASGAFGALAVAAGTLLATGIEKIASGLGQLATNAVSATAQMQALGGTRGLGCQRTGTRGRGDANLSGDKRVVSEGTAGNH